MLECLESKFHGLAIRIVKEEFDKCFLDAEGSRVESEISLPDWYGVKTNMINSIFTHNLDIYQTGLLRRIYSEYINYIYKANMDEMYYGNDLPKYSYDTFRCFLPVWEILRGLGVGEEHA